MWGVPGPAQRGEAVLAVRWASSSAWPLREAGEGGGRCHTGVNVLGGACAPEGRRDRAGPEAMRLPRSRLSFRL